jgi:hypothetical protein
VGLVGLFSAHLGRCPFPFGGSGWSTDGWEIEFHGDSLVAFAAALGVFVALKPAVDAGVAALHVEDGFGAGVGFAAVVDKLVEVFAGFHWRLG